MSAAIRPVRESDIDAIIDHCPPWSTPPKLRTLWDKYLHEQHQGIRTVGIVTSNEDICGYGSLLLQSEYPHFSNIPEIADVWIYDSFRRQGNGTKLIRWLEDLARQKGYADIGIGVGLYADYGPAQQLYFQLGYQPDGNGITYKCKPTTPGQPYPLDDDLILWLRKRLLTT